MGGGNLSRIRGIFVTLAFLNAIAMGVILHPASQRDFEWLDKPDSSVLGRWAGNTSCVAVGRNYVITTRHQGGGVGSIVQIGGTSYIVDYIANHPVADLRVARLKNSVLDHYVELYDTSYEISTNIVIGGYGDGWSEELKTNGVTYGYKWDNSSNTVQRWGTNRVEYFASTETGINYLIAFFDDPGETPFECSIADHDSGGGWFINCCGIWKVAGLSAAVETHYNGNVKLEETWYRDPVWPRYRSHPDYIDALRISPHAQWIRDQIVTDCQEPPPGDVNTDCKVDIFDIQAIAEWWLHDDCGAINNFCQNADNNRDGNIDLADLTITINNWGS
ncbi:MAG: hypothetical protein KAS23_05925 [Anaerohalosphaera sp.]|nr:hypothetical protein [Anaerohalosphaera sp.]